MKLTVWGAARQVTGSMHLLELRGGTRVLVDCGLDYEKRKDFENLNAKFPFDPESIDLLILTHAHIDHSGNVPNLIKQGFKGEILMTAPTLELSEFLLIDSLNIQRMEAQGRERSKVGGSGRHKKQKKKIHLETELLYSKKNITEMVLLTRCIDFGEKYIFNDELSIEFSVAGHILGAASARLEVTEGSNKRYIGFTGDLGNYNSKLVPDPIPMQDLDYLITESTYGGRAHQNVGDAGGELLHYINETCIRKGGKLIIPAFSVGRTQAIIFTLNELYSQGRLPEVNIFTDSPLAIRSTTTYQSNYKYLNKEALEFQKKYHSLFNFPQLHIIDNDKESEMLSAMPGAAVIISAAGMVEGGRIQMHVRNNIGYEENTILIAGFCAEGTLGHRLMQGQDFIEINRKQRPARAAVHKTDTFSAHPDHEGLLQYIGKSINPNLKGIFLVHADAFQMDLLAKDIPFEHVHTPAKGDEFILE